MKKFVEVTCSTCGKTFKALEGSLGAENQTCAKCFAVGMMEKVKRRLGVA
jgi:predicted nucleic-acid-binding Zn-ribbon protein